MGLSDRRITSHFSIADLAGCEHLSVEAFSINKSMLTLGYCICEIKEYGPTCLVNDIPGDHLRQVFDIAPAAGRHDLRSPV
jgi:hypothetical protein